MQSIVPSRGSVATIALSLLIALSIVGGCSESGTTAPTVQSSTPRVGTTYRFHRFEADTLGVALPGSDDTAVTTVVNVNASLDGQSDVHVFIQGSDTVARLRYQSNGNVLYYPGWARALRSGWIELPVSTRGSTDRTLKDTAVDVGSGQSASNRVTLSISHESTEQLNVGSDTLETHRMRMRIIEINPLSTDLNLIDTTTHTVWYAPRLGYFARHEIARSQQQPFMTVVFPTEMRVLTSFDLK